MTDKVIKELENGKYLLEDGTIITVHEDGYCPERNQYVVVEREIIDYEEDEENGCYPIHSSYKYVNVK